MSYRDPWQPPTEIHELKTLSVPFAFVHEGRKRFEIRRYDRNFKTGDLLRLREWEPDKGYTGRFLLAFVTFILWPGEFGCPEGYCIMSLGPIQAGREESAPTPSKEPRG